MRITNLGLNKMIRETVEHIASNINMKSRCAFYRCTRTIFGGKYVVEVLIRNTEHELYKKGASADDGLH